MSKKKKAARAKNKAMMDKVTRQCRPEEKYKFCKTLGNGKFGKVKLAIDRVTGKEFAIKIMDTDILLELEHEYRMVVQLVTEISIMDYIRHPNVLRLYDLMAFGEKVYLVLEYAPGGDLLKKIREKGRLEEAVARKYFQQLIHAVDYMHSKGVCHRDLKPANLLLDSNGDLKVADFGFGTVFLNGLDGKLVPGKWATRAFAAPEATKGHQHDGSKSDVWSCGVILFMCISGRLPFELENPMSLVTKKMSRAEFSFPGGFSDAAMDLIRKILDPNPTTRITTTDIMKTDWFNEEGFHSPKSEDVDVSCVHRWPLLLKTMGLPKLLCDLEEEEEITVFHTIASRCNLNSFSKNKMGRPVRQTIFTCKCPAEVLISIIEEAAKSVGLFVNWINLLQNTLNLLKLNAGKGKYKLKLHEKNIKVKDQLAMKIESYKLVPSDPYFMVEFSKSKGDTLEFHKVYEEIYTFFKRAIRQLTEKVELEEVQCKNAYDTPNCNVKMCRTNKRYVGDIVHQKHAN